MAFNPLQNFNQGFGAGRAIRDEDIARDEDARLRSQRESALNAGQQSEAFKQLVIDQPNFAFAVKKNLNTDDQGLNALIEDSAMIKHQLEIDPTGESAMGLLQNRKQLLDNNFAGQGRNSFHTDRAISVLQNEGPQALLDNVNQMLDIPNQIAQFKKGESTETSTFNNLLNKAGLSKEERKKAARIKLRLDPGAVGSASQTTSQSEQLMIDVANSEAAITAAKETAKLQSQLKLSPKIAEAVALSTAKANLVGAQNKEARSNQKALAVYDVAFKSLGEALGNTYTGPIVGLMPALTSNAQTANGAVSIVLPTLKAIFREAGEGNFSDADQALLVDLAPTRTDEPATIKWKLNAIDAIVRAKLGGTAAQPAQAMGSAQEVGSIQQPQVIKFDAQGNQI